MDEKTTSVRALYEAFPYPSGNPELRIGADARLALSKSSLAGPPARTIHVLDAGCGRAIGLIGAAAIQPDVQFVGADINRVALQEAEAVITERGLENIKLAEVDLTTLEGLEVPEGGFDVIQSSGVIHHLEDPLAGLQQLTKVLAPHGVIVLMVYGRLGRQGYERVTAFIDALAGPEHPIEQRLAVAREALGAMVRAGAGEPWQTALATDDVEFVDRYLHIQEASYSVPELYELLDAADLQPAGWCLPRQWSPEVQLPAEIAGAIGGLEPVQRDALIEQVTSPRVHELYVIHKANTPAVLPQPTDLENRIFAVSPEGTFVISRRSVPGESRIESLMFNRTDGARLDLSAWPLALAGLLIADQTGPFDGATFISALTKEGVIHNTAVSTLYEFMRQGIIYCVHPEDLVL
jgi:SAM-dependent methyltransferase